MVDKQASELATVAGRAAAAAAASRALAPARPGHTANILEARTRETICLFARNRVFARTGASRATSPARVQSYFKRAVVSPNAPLCQRGHDGEKSNVIALVCALERFELVLYALARRLHLGCEREGE